MEEVRYILQYPGEDLSNAVESYADLGEFTLFGYDTREDAENDVCKHMEENMAPRVVGVTKSQYLEYSWQRSGYAR